MFFYSPNWDLSVQYFLKNTSQIKIWIPTKPERLKSSKIQAKDLVSSDSYPSISVRLMSRRLPLRLRTDCMGGWSCSLVCLMGLVYLREVKTQTLHPFLNRFLVISYNDILVFSQNSGTVLFSFNPGFRDSIGVICQFEEVCVHISIYPLSRVYHCLQKLFVNLKKSAYISPSIHFLEFIVSID